MFIHPLATFSCSPDAAEWRLSLKQRHFIYLWMKLNRRWGKIVVDLFLHEHIQYYRFDLFFSSVLFGLLLCTSCCHWFLCGISEANERGYCGFIHQMKTKVINMRWKWKKNEQQHVDYDYLILLKSLTGKTSLCLITYSNRMVFAADVCCIVKSSKIKVRACVLAGGFSGSFDAKFFNFLSRNTMTNVCSELCSSFIRPPVPIFLMQYRIWLKNYCVPRTAYRFSCSRIYANQSKNKYENE